MKMEILLEILQELHPDIDFINCTALIDEKILDSFDIVTLISEIQEEFEVTIPAQEITPENFNSAADLYALIERLAGED